MSLAELRVALATEGLSASLDDACLNPAQVLTIASADWGDAARVAAATGWRWSALWGDDLGAQLRLSALLERRGTYALLRTEVPAQAPTLPSQAPYYPAADRPERHTQDMFGLRFAGHPDPRRWTRHQAWPATSHPLRKAFPAAGQAPQPTPGDYDYPFIRARGAAVHEIPVGPIHAGIIEPGHFRFQAVGEEVLNLEERLGYVHKGIEKIAEGRDAEGLLRLAERVSGDSVIAHGWAACMALERAAGIAIPPRAAALRAVLAERERIANHLGDIGAICNDVGFSFAQYQFTRLREDWLRENQRAFGHRLLREVLAPGGVRRDLEPEACVAMRRRCARLAAEAAEIVAILERSDSLEDRLMTTGRLAPEQAARLGCLGYVGKASGCTFDVRRDSPYPPYDQLEVRIPGYRAGDVAARAKVRAEEIQVSLALLGQLLERLPAGELATPWRARAAEGLGIVEGWRGETLAYVRLDATGRIARYFPRDPSWLNWPALELLIHDNIVPDFPVCNKSVNGSYSGHDL
ncbi:MAG TPA: NADH-quinone oxidoreductase subunit C [Candidatus Competibacteraceae bacterium]|nr:NADH-quinone oxidoreductase subunit C [Candidatus Competibacteraceae bacterium]